MLRFSRRFRCCRKDTLIGFSETKRVRCESIGLVFGITSPLTGRRTTIIMEFAFLDLTPRLAIVEHAVNQVAEHFRQMGDFAVGGVGCRGIGCGNGRIGRFEHGHWLGGGIWFGWSTHVKKKC